MADIARSPLPEAAALHPHQGRDPKLRAGAAGAAGREQAGRGRRRCFCASQLACRRRVCVRHLWGLGLGAVSGWRVVGGAHAGVVLVQQPLVQPLQPAGSRGRRAPKRPLSGA